MKSSIGGTKQIVLTSLLLACMMLSINAQKKETSLFNSSKTLMQSLKKDFADQISDDVRLVGFGTLQMELQEPLLINGIMSRLLVEQKNFNILALDHPDWIIRPLNSYLQGNSVKPSTTRLDSLFKLTFEGSPYYTENFKDIIRYVYQRNLLQSNDRKVQIKGVLFPGAGPLRLNKMNDQFIDLYVRPVSREIADSISKVWQNSGNSNSLQSDSIIITWMRGWADYIKAKDKLTPETFKQMSLDIGHRLISFQIFSKKEKNFNMFAELISYTSIIENGLINDLMTTVSNKVIFLTTNTRLAVGEVKLCNKDSMIYKMPTNGPLYRKLYKSSYLATAVTFSEKADIFGYKPGSRNLGRFILDADKSIPKSVNSKSIYHTINDPSTIRDINIPIVNRLFPDENYSLQFNYINNEQPFDKIFVLKILTQSESLK